MKYTNLKVPEAFSEQPVSKQLSVKIVMTTMVASSVALRERA